ncbi:MAG: class I SAM-dependent methyltransferase [Saprospirales bacterium]|nr:class I SAM-dependent methyltransferase [Saprospirales bacterium]
MSEPIYNQIGVGYNNNRAADPYIAERVIAQLQPTTDGIYLDIGCGTANYTHYIAQKGFTFYGVDPSDIMLDIAKTKNIGGTFTKATAEQIPFEDNFFDGAIAMLTLHHWKNKQQGFNELYRVLKPNSNLVFLSFTGEQMNGYWLKEYFPEMIKQSGELIIPDEKEMFAMFTKAGFSDIQTEKYFVQPDIQDHFLYSYKFQPEKYLDAEVRKGSSGFTNFCSKQELKSGLKLLEDDITSGKIKEIIKSYENDNGDYLFYNAVK